MVWRAANMPIAYLTLELRIEGAHSLKDKRQVVRSIKDRLRNSFNISIAEIQQLVLIAIGDEDVEVGIDH